MIKTKVITFLFMIAFLLCCQNHNTITVENRVQDIDNLPISKSLYVFEVDSNKIIIDTLAFRTLKYDLNKNLLFESNEQIKSDFKTINYYDTKNGMIYSEVRNNDGKISDFKTVIKDDLIVSASYNIYDKSHKIDSVIMTYYYTYNDGKKNKLLIDSGDDFITTEYYNLFEKPILNVTLSYNDTIEKTDFIYESNVLIKKIYENISKNEKIIYKYNNHNDLVEEIIFKNEKIDSTIYYYKDNNGNYLIYKQKGNIPKVVLSEFQP